MFGYVRPLKPELLVREYARYRSVYCGLCKQIGHDYGQLPRLSVGYDMTFLAILLLSLSDGQIDEKMEGCVLNPMKKKPILRGGPVLELCAGLSVMLAGRKAADDRRDGKPARGIAAAGVFGQAARKAEKRFGRYGQIIRQHLNALAACEAGEPDLAAAGIFGGLLSAVFEEASGLTPADEAVRRAMGLLGCDIGQWIYLLDAIDDLGDDCNNGNWNPFSRREPEKARQLADAALTELEQSADRTAALLPYCQDVGLIANIITLGMPATRRQVLSGNRLPRL